MSAFTPQAKLPPEQQAIRAKCFHPTGNFIEFNKEEVDQSIPARFDKIVRELPDHLAVKTNNDALTYQELNKAANRLAHAILEKLNSRSEPVILLCNHGLASITSCLAILKAGKILIAVDPTSPVERIAQVFENSQAAALLTDNANRSSAMASTKTAHQVINVDDIKNDFSDEDIRMKLSPETPAEIRYSSGSTGQPNGTVWSHRRLLHSARLAINAIRLCHQDRLLVLDNLSFGSRLTVRGLVAGATLCPFDIRKEALSNLAAFIRQQEITYYDLVPSTFRSFVSVLDEKQTFPSIRLIHLSGEPLAERDVLSYRKHFSDHCILVNRLSCAEAGNLCQYFIDKKTEISTPIVPVGYPVEGKEILLLDENGRQVGSDEVGEIAVRSSYLSSEYWRQPDLTRSKFRDDPSGGDRRLYLTGDLGRKLADGRFVHLGRKDLEVKIRGCKVAIAEVEMVLRECSLVKDAAVKGWDNESAEKYLAAYVVPQKETERKASELYEFLRSRLPDYMIPSRLVFLDALPLTASGKIDRPALAEPSKSRPELRERFMAPRTATEEILAGIWASLLGVDGIGIRDSFFDLGGHSLLAVRLFAEVEKAFKKRPPSSGFFQEPTIEHLATLISQENPTTTPTSLVAIQPRGAKLPFFCVHELFGDVFCYANLATHLGDDQPFYALEAPGLDGREEPFTSIMAMATHYIEAIRTVQPQGPYALGGLCFGGVVAFEMAQQLRLKGEAVSLVALLDSGINSGKGRVKWRSFLRNLPRDLPSWLIGSLQLNRAQWATLIRQKIRMNRASLRYAFGSSRDGSHQDGVPVRIQELGDFFQFSEQHRKVARAQYWALKEYTPRMYPGRLTLFRARMQPFFSSHAPDKGWGRLAAGGLDIRIVPGNHLGMLQEPHVKTLAENLKACLEKARS